MGSEFVLRCKKCGYEKGFQLGIGMMYSSLEHIIDCVHARRRKLILGILKNKTIPQHKDHPFETNPFYEHRVYRCKTCNKLYQRFYVKIDYEDNGVEKTYETRFSCSKCMKKLLPAGDNSDVIKKHPCPCCGAKKLEKTQGGFWD